MSTTQSREELLEQRIVERVGRGAKRFGYLLAAAINAVMLWVVHQLLDWEWPGFLTPEFDDVLPILTFSFVVSIAVNLVYAWRDAYPIKSIGEMTTAAIGFAVTLRTWRVFPFDFSGYDADWSWLVRLILIVAMIGTAIGFVAESVKLGKGPSTKEETS
jgi:hypothetical protein